MSNILISLGLSMFVGFAGLLLMIDVLPIFIVGGSLWLIIKGLEIKLPLKEK